MCCLGNGGNLDMFEGSFLTKYHWVVLFLETEMFKILLGTFLLNTNYELWVPRLNFLSQDQHPSWSLDKPPTVNSLNYSELFSLQVWDFQALVANGVDALAQSILALLILVLTNSDEQWGRN